MSESAVDRLDVIETCTRMKAPSPESEKSVESARITAACGAWSAAGNALPRRSALPSIP